MSDRIGVMRDGGLAQIGSPHEIYSNPVDRFVSEFMGEVNSIAVTRGNDGELWCESLGATINASFYGGGFLYARNCNDPT